jgi:uncharacterized DUF497 family protein
VRYEWDDEKAESNFRKHEVDFVDAIPALEDPNRVEDVDPDVDHGEERIRVTGMTQSGVLFVVIALPEEDAIRIISARKATRNEEDRYYAGDCETW